MRNQPSSSCRKRKKRRNRRDKVKLRGNEVYDVLCTTILDIDLRKDVLSYILKGKFGADIYFDKVKLQQLPVVNNIAVILKGGFGTSNRSFERMMKVMVLFIKDNNMLQLFGCATGGDKSKMCVHYWIPQIILLCHQCI